MSRVLFSIGSLGGGGAERVVSVWTRQLLRQGIEVGVLVYGRTEKEYAIEDGVSILTIVPSYQDYPKLSYFQRVRRAREEIKKYKPDVVISFLQRNQITTMFATWGLSVRRVETVRISPWEVYKDNALELLLWKLCFRTCYAAIVQTAEQAEYFSKAVQKKVVVVSNPLGDQYIEKYKEDYSESAHKFIAAGRINEQKNYPLMIKAFAEAQKREPDITLRIFGDGDKEYIATLKKLIKELDLEETVVLCGKTMTIDSEFRSSDVYIMSSDYEGMPNSLAEAMASGLVCISTNCRTGPKDLIDNGVNGFLTKVGDIESMAEVILKACRMTREESARMGKRAREKALSTCGPNRSIDKLITIVEKRPEMEQIR
jgi:GalNAc-alpha-(1->4)-GalNAc-alpha-(1->3)-diNAcBac-PP-undecaprenol alpha-1,4-N-acetyl-D-galactosaminyltransferase